MKNFFINTILWGIFFVSVIAIGITVDMMFIANEWPEIGYEHTMRF